jgi:hypothetical protein
VIGVVQVGKVLAEAQNQADFAEQALADEKHAAQEKVTALQTQAESELAELQEQVCFCCSVFLLQCVCVLVAVCVFLFLCVFFV